MTIHRSVDRGRFSWHLDTALLVLFVVDFIVTIVLAFFLSQAVESLNANLKLTCENREVLLHVQDHQCDPILGR